MTSTVPCGMPACDTSVAERPRYFPRQILTPDDLTLEQEYFRNKLRRHNRIMHGWGVVCGARICPVLQPGPSPNAPSSYQPWIVSVSSGYVLGPYGDEIVLDCCRTINLQTSGATGITGEPCVEPVDPWCSEVFVQRDTPATLYIAVKYKECKTRPVRVQPAGCGCDDSSCEYSRLRDGYEIGVLVSCPDQNEQPPNLEDLTKGGTPDCPACPAQPWVVLGAVQVGEDGTILSIDNCQCRRIVLSFGGFWRQCRPGMVSITGVAAAPGSKIDPKKIPQGSTAPVVVTFDPKTVISSGGTLQADIGPGTTSKVESFQSSPPSATLTIVVDATAAPGPRTLTVITSDGAEASLENAINIVASDSTPADDATRTASGPVPAPVLKKSKKPKE